MPSSCHRSEGNIGFGHDGLSETIDYELPCPNPKMEADKNVRSHYSVKNINLETLQMVYNEVIKKEMYVLNPTKYSCNLASLDLKGMEENDEDSKERTI